MTTRDGYILTLFRITGPIDKQEKEPKEEVKEQDAIPKLLNLAQR